MSSPSSAPPAVLTFSATDPSCGAGMQADILTLASMGCHPLAVVTAITVQDTAGVENFFALDPDWVADQARCILEDVPVVAFKVGVLASPEIVTVVAEIVSDYPDIPLILDPVFASGRGDEFGGEDLVGAIRELMVPQSTVVTPNISELRRLADVDEDENPDNAECARRILDVGCEYVLVTGTHDATASVINTLHHRDGIVRTDTWPRLPGSFHGSGCTLASAIAANLARGLDVADAVHEAQEYTWQALARAFRPGMGQHVPDRLFWARDDDEESGDAA